MKNKVLALAILGCLAGSSNTAQANVVTDFCSGYYNLHKTSNYCVGFIPTTLIAGGIAFLVYKKVTEDS